MEQQMRMPDSKPIPPERTTGKRPDALVIGAQKCATTWLYHCLEEHPDLYLPERKLEVEYLTSPRYAHTGLEPYWALFQGARPEQRIVDVSVEYLNDPRAPAAVAEQLPEALLFVSIRDPVDRAVSAFNWYVRKAMLPATTENVGLRKALTLFREGGEGAEAALYVDLIQRGFYHQHLGRLLEHIPGDRVIVLSFDQIVQRPVEVIQGIYERLGVRPDHEPASLDRRPKASARLRLVTSLERSVHPDPAQRTLIGRLVIKLAQTVNELAAGSGLGGRQPFLEPDLHRDLRSLFREANRELPALLDEIHSGPPAARGTDIEHWF